MEGSQRVGVVVISGPSLELPLLPVNSRVLLVV
jgi:hypothetical protein